MQICKFEHGLEILGELSKIRQQDKNPNSLITLDLTNKTATRIIQLD